MQMKKHTRNLYGYVVQIASLLLLVLFAFWIKRINPGWEWQGAGVTTFSLGFILLTSYIAARVLKTINLPLISGYIFVGIIAGPYVTGFLSEAMVGRLRIVDDLALSFIAMTAGGTLQMEFFKKRSKAISINILFQTVIIFGLVFVSLLVIHRYSASLQMLSWQQVLVIACLLGVISVARSPSSTIAVINECRSTGFFTATVLGVTVAMDVLIIILFSFAMMLGKTILATGLGAMDYEQLFALCLTVTGSLVLGGLFGKAIALYIKRIGHDLPLFLLFFAFGVFKVSEWTNHVMDTRYGVSLLLEPLLICMSAGFAIQNFSDMGRVFIETMEKMALPIYVVFFSLAGAALNLDALWRTWPLALFLVLIRASGLLGATWLSGTIIKDQRCYRKIEWMSYLTQAGVSIGLAQLAQKQFPEIGMYLTPLVLAVITINQVIGPITFKAALFMAGEAKRSE